MVCLDSNLEKPCKKSTPQQYNYTVKIISSPTKAGFAVEKLGFHTRFDTMDAMRSELKSQFSKNFLEGDREFSFGYIIRGHGVKGKKCPIATDDNVNSMYEEYHGRGEVVLWLKVDITKAASSKSQHPGRKRKRSLDFDSDEENPKPTPKKKTSGKYQSHLNKLSEVEVIVEELEERHRSSSLYSDEQLRIWAHLLQMKKHSSYEGPPDKPFFRNSKPRLSDAKTPHKVPEGMSPAKRITMHTELLSQLEKGHDLMEKGALSPTQFKELETTILSDMKKL